MRRTALSLCNLGLAVGNELRDGIPTPCVLSQFFVNLSLDLTLRRLVGSPKMGHKIRASFPPMRFAAETRFDTFRCRRR